MTWTWRGSGTLWREATGLDITPRDIVEGYLDDRGQLPPDDILDDITQWYVGDIMYFTDHRITVTPLGSAWLRPRYTLTREQVVDILGHAYRAASIHDTVAAYRRDHDDYEPYPGETPRGVR